MRDPVAVTHDGGQARAVAVEGMGSDHLLDYIFKVTMSIMFSF